MCRTFLHFILHSAIPSLLLLILLGTSAGCESTTDSGKDKDPSDTTKNPIDTSFFRITSVIHDSLYGNEIAMLTANGMGVDITRLRLFIHSREATLLTLKDDSLTFLIPVNGVSGKLRLYLDDSIHAGGDFSMLLYGGNIDKIKPIINRVYPGWEVYIGETITLDGQDFPMRRKDLDARIGDIPMEILSQDSLVLRMRLPAGAKNGVLTIRMFGEPLDEKGPLTVLQQGGEFLPSETFSYSSVEMRDINGQMEIRLLDEFDSVVNKIPSGSIDLGTTFGPYYGEAKRVGDSLILESNNLIDVRRSRATVRLKLEHDSNFVAGSVECVTTTNEGTVNEKSERFKATIKGMRWREYSGSYLIYSLGLDVGEQLIDVSYDYNLDQDFQSTILQYDHSALPSGSFYITISP